MCINMCVCVHTYCIYSIHTKQVQFFSHFIFIFFFSFIDHILCSAPSTGPRKWGSGAWLHGNKQEGPDCSLLLNIAIRQWPSFYFDSVNPEAASKLELNLNSRYCLHPHPDSVRLPACRRTASCQTDDRLNLSPQHAFSASEFGVRFVRASVTFSEMLRELLIAAFALVCEEHRWGTLLINASHLESWEGL